MCIIAGKYFNNVGWVFVKNRDRNYKPVINIRQSFRNGIERMYIWDEKTKYTEGINEYGIGILSTATAVKMDEKEGDKADEKEVKKDRVFYSPDGKKIRTALFQKTVNKAVDAIIEGQLCGNTVVFSKDEAILIEGARDIEDMYQYEFKKLAKNKEVVRTNHGIWLEWAGYQEETHPEDRESSVSRYDQVVKDITKVKVPRDMFNCISNTENKDYMLNPLRMPDNPNGKMRTTGQIMLIPEERLMVYRPISCDVKFNFDKLNSPKSKTYFEAVSSRFVHDKILQSSSLMMPRTISRIVQRIAGD
jgi:hypothetical protein